MVWERMCGGREGAERWVSMREWRAEIWRKTRPDERSKVSFPFFELLLARLGEKNVP